MNTIIYMTLFLFILTLIWAFVNKLPILTSNPMGLSSNNTFLFKHVKLHDDNHLEGIPVVQMNKQLIYSLFNRSNLLLMSLVNNQSDDLVKFLKREKGLVWIHLDKTLNVKSLHSFNGLNHFDIV